MTRLSVCSLGVSCNEMIDTPMLLVVTSGCVTVKPLIVYIKPTVCVIICANIMFMFVIYFQLLLINMFVFLLCLDTIVCHSIGYTFYDQLLCYVLLLYNGPIELCIDVIGIP